MPDLQKMLAARRIAVVGLSDDASRPAWMIADYLRSIGREIVPVNPKFETVMGVNCYPTVAAIPGRVDLVDVFRRSIFCADVVRDSIAAHAGGVWLQSGITSAEAKKLAEEAGLDYVENRCLMVEIERHGATGAG